MLVVDTGPLVATADRADKDHAACRALLEGDQGPLVTTGMVIAEAAHLIDRQLGPQAEGSCIPPSSAGSSKLPISTVKTGNVSVNWSPPMRTCA